MAPKVRRRKKGKLRVEFDDTRDIPPEALECFAHELCGLKGVKRAYVRTESGRRFIFARINVNVPELVEEIRRLARRFWRKLCAPPAPRRHGGRVLPNKTLAMRARQRSKRQPPRLALADA